MKHEGKALAADEIDAHHPRHSGVASVHVRAVVTWMAIFPMVAVGMTVMNAFAYSWPPVLRSLVLTAVVVPTAVYFLVPRLLLLQARMAQKMGAARRTRPAVRSR